MSEIKDKLYDIMLKNYTEENFMTKIEFLEQDALNRKEFLHSMRMTVIITVTTIGLSLAGLIIALFAYFK